MTDAKIEFGTFTAPEKVNPYTETIDKLIEAGEDAAITVTVDATKETKERNLISKAANAKDKTARQRVRDTSKVKYGQNDKGEQVATGGTVSLTFTLTKRHEPRRRKAAETPAQG